MSTPSQGKMAAFIGLFVFGFISLVSAVVLAGIGLLFQSIFAYAAAVGFALFGVLCGYRMRRIDCL